MMIKEKGSISMRTAAIVAVIPLFLPAAPYAEFYVFKNMLVSNDAAQTTQNLLNDPKLFLSGIFAILFTYIYDIVLAWAMYIFLRPANAWLSLLAGWLRIVYAGLAIVALFNFIYAFHLVNIQAADEGFKNAQVLQLVNARRFAMNLAYIVFGIYLVLLGILIYKASYIPTIMGVLIMLAGGAWIIHSLGPYFFKGYDLTWVRVFSFGELAFAIWLLVKGTRIKEPSMVAS